MKFSIANFQPPISFARRARQDRKLAVGNWKCAGFTLIEIMVAIAIFTLVIAAVYSAWMALLRSTKVAEDVASQAQRQRVTLRTIEDSLMAIQSFQASPQYYSFVLENGQSPTLSFTARVPDVFPRNGKFVSPISGKEFNLRRLTYSLEAGSDGEKNLVLRQNPVLQDMDKDERQYPLVLARNVQKFTVECWDTNKLDWADEWNDTNAIPPLLRVQLVLGSTMAAGSTPEVQLTRLLSPPSQIMPAAAQNGQGAAGGAPSPVFTPPQPARTK
jgi:prepilin-type N-terminal cleavage/methylation domain-containing protein